MNPFLNASLSDLIAMVPGLSNSELDALAAMACDGEWVFQERWQVPYYRRILPMYGPRIIDSPTTDPREAMRLLVKYRISVCPMGETSWWVRKGLEKTRVHINDNPCRAITEAAVIAALTDMEGGVKPCA